MNIGDNRRINKIMTKIGKLRLCNRLLFFMTLMIFVSSVQLEIIGSSNPFWIWGHIFVGCLFVGNVVWYLYLHYGWNSWIRRVYRQKKIMNKWLSVLINPNVHECDYCSFSLDGNLYPFAYWGHTWKGWSYFSFTCFRACDKAY